MTEEAAQRPTPGPTPPPVASAPAGGPNPPWDRTGPPTAATTAPPPPGGGASFTSRYGLVRPHDGRYLAGVCAAIGRATNTDPVLWRVLLAVLGFFGGIGILVYVSAWLIIPGEGDTASPVESMLGRGRSSMSPVTVIVLSILVAVSFAFIVTDAFRAVLLGAAILICGALLLNRDRPGGQPVGAPQPGPAAPPPGPAAAPSGPAPAPAAPAPGPVPPVSYPAPTGSPVTTPAEAPALGAPAAPTPAAEPTLEIPPAPAVAGEPTAELPRPDPVEPRSVPASPAWPAAPAWTPPPSTPAAPGAPSTAPLPGGYRPPFAPHGPYAGSPVPAAPPVPARPPRAPKRPRERSALGAVTFSLIFLALGLVAVLDLAGVFPVGASAYFAAVLATTGLGLLVGTWFGRARWLIALGLVTAAALAVATVAESYDHIRGVDGAVTWAPASHAELATRYENSFGDSVLDLRSVDFTGKDTEITVAVNFGEATVVVPPDVDVTVSADVNAGDAVVFGHRSGGLDERAGGVDGPLRETTDLGPDGPGGGKLRLFIHVNAGKLEVTR